MITVRSYSIWILRLTLEFFTWRNHKTFPDVVKCEKTVGGVEKTLMPSVQMIISYNSSISQVWNMNETRSKCDRVGEVFCNQEAWSLTKCVFFFSLVHLLSKEIGGASSGWGIMQPLSTMTSSWLKGHHVERWINYSSLTNESRAEILLSATKEKNCVCF